MKLKHVATSSAGGTPDTSNPVFWTDPGEGTPWVSIGDMSGRSFVHETNKAVTPAGLVDRRLKPSPPGTVLFAMYASVGEVSTLAVPAVWNQALLGLQPLHGRAEGRFLAYWLRHFAPVAVSQANAATQANLGAEQVMNFPFPDIAVEEQRRIADFLDDRVVRIDQIIAARQQQSLRLNEQFGTHRQLAVRGLEQPTGGSPAPSWIGRIHPGWRTRRSGQMADFFAGVGFPPDEQGASVGHLPLLKVSDLAAANELREVATAANWITEEQAAKLGAHPAPEGTILFPKVGAALLTNSRAIAVRPVAFDNNVMGMRFREGDDRYWLHVLHCIDMGAVTNPGPVPSINRENVASLPVPCPPSQEQANIAARLDSALASGRARQSQLGQQIELLQEYKQSLITAAVTGEFDVTTAAPIPE